MAFPTPSIAFYQRFPIAEASRSPVRRPERARRARALARLRGALPLTALLVLSALACGPDAAETSDVRAGDGRSAWADPELAVRDLVAALTPPSPAVTSDVLDDWVARRRATLVRQRGAGAAVGREALRRFRAEPALASEVRQGLLDVAAHNLPDEVAPVLEELIAVYGEDLGVRTAAAELLAEVAPARAAALLEPIVREARHSRTYPPQETLLRAYAAGTWGSGGDPGMVLAEVATDLRQDDAARAAALEALKRCVSGPAAAASKQALETVLVESTGNGYLRRKAAQAIRDSFPAAEACALFERVASLEADLNFGMFLADMLAESCP
jgi:hypothetical protein